MEANSDIELEILEFQSEEKPKKKNKNCIKIDRWIWNGYVFTTYSKSFNHLKPAGKVPLEALIGVRIVFAIYLLATSIGLSVREQHAIFLFSYYQLWITTIYFVLVAGAHLRNLGTTQNDLKQAKINIE